ncbi:MULTISPECIES: hypothetical protein [unclassified Arthrobacter]
MPLDAAADGEDIDAMEADPKTHLSHVRAAVLEVHNGDLVCIDA